MQTLNEFKQEILNNAYKRADNKLVCSFCGSVLEEKVICGIRCGITCQCIQAFQDEMEKKVTAQQKEKHVLSLKEKCFPNQTYWDYSFENSTHNSSGLTNCRKYVDTWDQNKEEPVSLVLWGGVGTGKTYAASAIANALMEREVPVQMLNLSSFLNCSLDERAKKLRDVSKPALLIIDDFGTGRNTDFSLEITFDVFDKRIQCRKPFILTTNLSINELQDTTVDINLRRIYDRIVGDSSFIYFGGDSLRQIDHNRQMSIMRERFSSCTTAEENPP